MYLDDRLWGALHEHARREKTTISELVRQAVRERYSGSREQRMAAMRCFVGSRKTRAKGADSSFAGFWMAGCPAPPGRLSGQCVCCS